MPTHWLATIDRNGAVARLAQPYLGLDDACRDALRLAHELTGKPVRSVDVLDDAGEMLISVSVLASDEPPPRSPATRAP